jgi:6-pyruvoyl-tetrahydropterin synthase
MRLTIAAAIQARWGHRVDDLIHTHAWTLEAVVEGPADAARVMPADELERILAEAVHPWAGRYLTDIDVGSWKGYEPLLWDSEPTVEEIVRHLWSDLEKKIDGLREIALEESNEFDRCRTVRLSRG